MRQIISTITPEQYGLITRGPDGALVIQGGPGTGKTAVGLHRAAWLLYADPALAREGVLVVGPNRTFIRYIAQVLPALGEQSVEQRRDRRAGLAAAPRGRREPRARDAEGQRPDGRRARAAAVEPAVGRPRATSIVRVGARPRADRAPTTCIELPGRGARADPHATRRARMRFRERLAEQLAAQRRAPDGARRAALERGRHQRGPQDATSTRSSTNRVWPRVDAGPALRRAVQEPQRG